MRGRRVGEAPAAGPRVRAAVGVSVTLAAPRPAPVRAQMTGRGGAARPIVTAGVASAPTVAHRARTGRVRMADGRTTRVPKAPLGRREGTVPARAATGGTIVVASRNASSAKAPGGVGTPATMAAARGPRTGR